MYNGYRPLTLGLEGLEITAPLNILLINKSIYVQVWHHVYYSIRGYPLSHKGDSTAKSMVNESLVTWLGSNKLTFIHKNEVTSQSITQTTKHQASPLGIICV